MDKLEEPFDMDLDQFETQDAPVMAVNPLPIPSLLLLIPPVSKHFTHVENDAEIDQLASSHLSLSTKRQNDWAVRVFHGKFICLYFHM